ncbi:gyloxalase/bleomycin resistance protein/dioxygenase-superfamily protein-like protein [Octadecabacter antarcticus 307]|uniref:Gyloxalase/bleomycin resistance protein/dioxygenase-superfamily protein-like protein n=1 Tax=Octadecabacter antarcticus 307 TaxID=391626 RepID=M9R7Y9_9RHOB|nr:VOC family protein [Octadecabacter antarcticus]AGI67883.1 gyloxalase/bleomycin resistance protein/dioxygenase-superfamily protein-like protein [Octadecabacter antarcticus 307]
MAHLEHVNVTVVDPDASAAMLIDLFGWHRRWSGGAIGAGRSVHVGGEGFYLALYTGPDGVPLEAAHTSYREKAGLNHIGVVVDDLDRVEAAVKAKGYNTHSHADYEPGHRFYFCEENGIEIEVVSYD